MPPNGKPTIALLIETSRAYGRGLCLGVAEYARAHGEWNFLIEEHDLRGHLPEWISTWSSADVASRETLHTSGSPELEKWVASLAPGTAILACNDIRAQQLLKTAARVGRRVPEDLAVIGVDDDEVLCELTNPRLSSIHPDTRALGYTAAYRLHQRMQGRPLTHHSLLIPPLHITERASTDAIASDDAVFVSALRFIRDRAHEKIDAGKVVRHTGLSRSSIETRFRKILGRSIKDEITRARIARSLVLLHETQLTLQQIAESCGFATASHFSRIFKHSQGRTPGSFRDAAINLLQAE